MEKFLIFDNVKSRHLLIEAENEEHAFYLALTLHLNHYKFTVHKPKTLKELSLWEKLIAAEKDILNE